METTFQKISRKTGKKPSNCKCELCKRQCIHPCLGTPEDMLRILGAGYQNRVMFIKWAGALNMGVHDSDIPMLTPLLDEQKFACTFFTDGLCELHALGLKPTEGRLSHHSTAITTFNPKKSIGWAVAKEWLKLDFEDFKKKLLAIQTTTETNITKAADQVMNEGFHQCPYCDHKSMLINDHFSHIEMFHPGKSLI